MGQKMALSSYKKGLKRLIQMLTPVADHYGKPKLFFWLDALWANIRYGVTPFFMSSYIVTGFTARMLPRRRSGSS